MYLLVLFLVKIFIEEVIQDFNMKKKVIAYFNKQLEFYEHIRVIQDEPIEDIIKGSKRYLCMAPEQEMASCAGREIRLIGFLDDEDIKCPLQSLEEPVLIVDCDSILKERCPQMYEQK